MRCYLKPDTISFGRAMLEKEVEKATELSRNCDSFMVVGSTLVVQPAVLMPHYAKQSGAFLAIINLSETPCDEIDHVRRDLDSFLKFLVRRLPQSVSLRLVLVFSSNNLNWQDTIDPRIKSFLKVNEILFDPYNAFDLKKILSIRIKKALNRRMIQKGVLEKIAAVSSRTHGDARKAVELLSKSAQIVEKEGIPITLDLVDRALEEIERDKYVAMVKSGPKQLQAVLYSIISSASKTTKPLYTGEAYEAYRSFCTRIKLRALTQRAFSDLVSELDMYGFIQVRLLSQGRYGRTNEIMVNLPRELVAKLRQVVLMEFDLNTATGTFGL